MPLHSPLLRRLLAPLWRLLARWAPTAEHWERFDLTIEYRKFGRGSIASFKWYFQGASRVPVNSLDELKAWLIGCSYESDQSLFASADHWQHPSDFERLRRGDCEDHALWAWRKLIELGVDAEFVVGRHASSAVGEHGHAWVLFRDEGGREHLLEAVAKDAASLVRPIEEARHEYVPHFAVTKEYRTVAFGGYLEDTRRRNGAPSPGASRWGAA